DACGTFSQTKREVGLLRMLQAGVITTDQRAPAYPVVSGYPYMLRSGGDEQILSTANPSVRRRRASSPEAEQGLKGAHRWPPTIVPKDEFVQVDRQLRLADPVVRANEPELQVADGANRQRHDGGDSFR